MDPRDAARGAFMKGLKARKALAAVWRILQAKSEKVLAADCLEVAGGRAF